VLRCGVVSSYSDGVGGRGDAGGVPFGMVQRAFGASSLLVSRLYPLGWPGCSLAQGNRGLVGVFLPSPCSTGEGARRPQTWQLISMYPCDISQIPSRERLDVQRDSARPWRLAGTGGERGHGRNRLPPSKPGRGFPPISVGGKAPAPAAG